MNGERYARIKDILLAARTLPPAERAAFVEQRCEGDAALRAEIESLLAHEEPESAMKSGAFAADVAHALEATARDASAGRLPEAIGRYRILELLGEGGMGQVFRAEQTEPIRRVVALKVIRVGLDSREFVRRFEAERQILARLEHPGIARLIDGGLTDQGLPWFTMEFVDGVPIDRYCEERAVPIAERLRLFRRVCAAVQFAHRNLVVHRDLKPRNILVAADGTVKLVDFGIAKVLAEGGESGGATLAGSEARLMTPEYAAPEQIRNEPVTTATDVYALGVILYRLLCGQHPYASATRLPHELEQAILTATPTAPSGVDRERRRQLTGDLDTICLQALRKEPERRYPSVDQLDEDIRRHLEGLPVLAQRDTLGYRAGKFVRRHRAAVVAAAGVVLVLAAVVTAYTVSLRTERDRAREAATRAELEARKANEVAAFVGGLFEGSDPAATRGEQLTAVELLQRGAARVRTELAGQPAVQASLLERIGSIHLALSRHDDAAALLDEALAIQRRLHGERHADYARILRIRGQLHDEAGDYVTAAAVLESTLALGRGVWGASHPEVVEALAALARVRLHQGRFDESERHLREALAIRQAADAAPDLVDARLRADLAEVLSNGRSQYGTADTMLTEALAIRRQRLGDVHPDVASNIGALGNVAYWDGRHDVALARYREANAINRRLYGDKHTSIATDLFVIGQVLGSKGDVEGAERSHREALAMRRELLGPVHRDIARSMNDLGIVLRMRGDYRESERMLRLALEHYRQSVAPDHPSIATAYGNLGFTLLGAGDTDAAIDAFLEGLRINRDTLSRSATMNNLALAYGRLKRYDDAESMLVGSARIRRRYIPRHPDFATTLINLAHLHLERGRPPAAEPLLLEGLDIYRRALPPGHWQIAYGTSALGQCRAELGDPAAAESLLTRSLEGVVAGGAPPHIQERCRGRLVRFYTQLGRREEAERIAAAGPSEAPGP